MSYVVSTADTDTERPAGHASEPVRPRRVTQTLGATAKGRAITRYSFRRSGGPPPGTVRTARTEAGQHNRSPSQTGRRPLQGRTLRERHHRSDGRTCRGDRCRARHGRLRACHRCRLPAAPRYRPRGHGAGRAAAGRIRPRHQGHRAHAQEPADRGHQGGAGRRGSPREGRVRRRGHRRRDQAQAPRHLPYPYGRRGPRREGGEGRQGGEGREEGGQDGRRQGRRPAADRDPRPALAQGLPVGRAGRRR